MSSSKANVDYLVSQMAGADNVSACAMFGEFAFYCDAKVVALFCNDQLYLKSVASAAKAIGTHDRAAPYPGAKLHLIVPEDRWDDAQFLSRLVRKTAEALPTPKPKVKKPKKK